MNQEHNRGFLVGVALAMCVVPLCLAPLAGRSMHEIASERELYDTRFSMQRPVGTHDDTVAVRDPFVPEDIPEPASTIAPGATQSPAPALSIIVHAVVTGDAARALVEENGRIRIVQPGEPLGNSRVASITGDGVRLENSMFYRLSEVQQ